MTWLCMFPCHFRENYRIDIPGCLSAWLIKQSLLSQEILEIDAALRLSAPTTVPSPSQTIDKGHMAGHRKEAVCQSVSQTPGWWCVHACLCVRATRLIWAYERYLWLFIFPDEVMARGQVSGTVRGMVDRTTWQREAILLCWSWLN